MALSHGELSRDAVPYGAGLVDAGARHAILRKYELDRERPTRRPPLRPADRTTRPSSSLDVLTDRYGLHPTTNAKRREIAV